MTIKEITRLILVPGKTLDGAGCVDHGVGITVKVQSHCKEAAECVTSVLTEALTGCQAETCKRLEAGAPK